MNCFNEQKNKGFIAGNNDDSFVSNCYFLELFAQFPFIRYIGIDNNDQQKNIAPYDSSSSKHLTSLNDYANEHKYEQWEEVENEYGHDLPVLKFENLVFE